MRMLDAEKLAYIMQRCVLKGICPVNTENGVAYDRVVKKALRKGYLTIHKRVHMYEDKNHSWRYVKITESGIEKLKQLDKKYPNVYDKYGLLAFGGTATQFVASRIGTKHAKAY